MPGPLLTRPQRLRRSARYVMFGAGLAGFLIAGCSKKADEVVLPGPTAPTAALTKDDYLHQANDVCRAAEKAIAQKTEEHGPSGLGAGSGQESAALVREIEPIATQAISRLRNLTPPVEDAERTRRGIDAMQRVLDNARTDPQALVDPIGTVQPDLYDYGLTACFAAK